MTRVLKRQQAIALRKEGKTYTEIRSLLKLPKSTLSDWLGKFPLTEAQLKILDSNKKNRKLGAIEKTIITKKKKRNLRLQETYFQKKKELIPLNKKELYFAGLFLYWGEGNKRLTSGQVSLNNTDPAVIKFYLFWLRNILRIPVQKIKVYIHLYSDMNINKERTYWSKELKLPLEQFMNPYIKKSKREEIDQKGYGHGTCGLVVNNTVLKEEILMGIKAIADHYAGKL